VKVAAVIPARYGSKRLPGKPLRMLGGKTIIQRVYERVIKARSVRLCMIATDDERIYREAEAFGALAVMTSPELNSGSERVAEAIERSRAEVELVVNVQGDEPFIPPELIDEVVAPMLRDAGMEVCTAKVRIGEPEYVNDPNVVKVVTDPQGWALYFSRSAIPYYRDDAAEAAEQVHYKHIGIYAYRLPALRRFVRWEPTPLERAEKLEQLRFLEHGVGIYVVETPHDSLGIDTEDDLKRAEKFGF